MVNDFLNWTIDDSPLVEILRFVTILTGGSVICFTLLHFIWYHIGRSTLTRRYLAGLIGFSCYGAVAVLQVLQTLGEPFLVWRLPLLFLASLNGVFFLWGEEVHRLTITDAREAIEDGADPMEVLDELESQEFK